LRESLNNFPIYYDQVNDIYRVSKMGQIIKVQRPAMLYVYQRMNAYKNMFGYILLHTLLLNDQSFHHWQNFVNQIDERNRFPHKICLSHHRVHPVTCVTCYCLTLNGRTIFIKAHSIDNNTIYVAKGKLFLIVVEWKIMECKSKRKWCYLSRL
jgi:hypothetical protein